MDGCYRLLWGERILAVIGGDTTAVHRRAEKVWVRAVKCQNSLVTIPPAGVQTPLWEFTAVLNRSREEDSVNTTRHHKPFFLPTAPHTSRTVVHLLNWKMILHFLDVRLTDTKQIAECSLTWSSHTHTHLPKLPVTGYADTNDPMKLVMPMASSSWLALIL